MRRWNWLWVAVPAGIGAGCTGLVALVVGLFILALFIIKIVWAWVIPDIFPGAVEQGLIVETLSWYTAFKLAIFVALLGGLAGLFRNGKSK